MTVHEAIRILYPSARRHHAVGIVHNGARRRVVSCILCGATESCCAAWPETVRVEDFRADHNRRCGERLIDRAKNAIYTDES